MKYYTLIKYELDSLSWCIGFGDKDLECVKFELQDERDHGVKAKHLKIIAQNRSPSYTQYEELQALVAAMNEGLHK